jgi:hypothetical protein
MAAMAAKTAARRAASLLELCMNQANQVVVFAKKHPIATGAIAAVVGLWLLPKIIFAVVAFGAVVVGGYVGVRVLAAKNKAKNGAGF